MFIVSFNSSMPGTGGIRPFSSMRTTLIRPANPLVASVWPMLAFTDPKKISLSRGVWQKTLLTEFVSAASPAAVPVPWAWLWLKSSIPFYESCLSNLPQRSHSRLDQFLR
jgi:hypothetical protein